jgi:hypothetical protein
MEPNKKEPEVKEVKRRGRKPKIDDAAAANALAAATATADGVVISANPIPDEPVKRGRKPKTIYNTYDVNDTATTSSNNINSSLSDDENIIIRLNVQYDNINLNTQNPCAYNDNDNINNNIYGDLSNTNSLGNDYKEILALSDMNNITIPQPEICDQLKVVNILKDFEEKNKNKEWPSNTSISCYWCCNRFDNAPYGIPITYHHDIFYVFGCFCSLECASAHNFQATNNIDEMWERYNLINLLARRLKFEKQIRPAPDRLALKMFGGYMEIDQFRNYTNTNKIININFPPMSSISQQIEEINEYELNNDYKYIPLDHERINKIKEQMVIKRNKPLINNKNSLENSMNLKVI